MMTKEQLVNLIKENPDAEILFMCGEDSWSEEYGYTWHYLSEARIGVEKLALYKEIYYEDEYGLKDEIEDDLSDYFWNLNASDSQKIIENEMKKYPFKKYIVIKIG